jgi:hypothetical protein
VSEQEVPAAPDGAANPPVPAASLSRFEMVAIALAVIGGGIVTLAVLSARGGPATEAAAASAAAASVAQHPAPVAALLQDGGPEWTANPARWVGNARRSVAFEVPSANKVSVWMRDVRPLLVVRCFRGSADVFVFTESAAMIERQTEDHTVRFAFDDEPEARELWPDSAEHDALFAPAGAAFARRLMTARTLRVGFTPHNAAPVTAHFRVSGLRELLTPAAADCGWKRD